MALVKGNHTADVRVPGSSSYSFSHNHNKGSDGYLVVIVASPTTNLSSVKYNGEAMKSMLDVSTSYSNFWRVYELDNPATGANNVAVTFTAAQWNSTSVFVCSFTGASGVGTVSWDNTQATPKTISLSNISANAMIIGCAIGGNNTNANMEIPQGTARTLLFNHNINNYTWGAVSPRLPAGAYTIESNATAPMIILGVEVEEATAPTTRRIFLVS